MKNVRKNLTLEMKEKIFHDIQEGESSLIIQEKYGLTPSKFNYYKKLNEKSNSVNGDANSRKKSNIIENKGSLVSDFVISINKLKREKQSKKEGNSIVDIKDNDHTNYDNPTSNNNNVEYGSGYTNFQPISLKDYLKFTIDGIEILVRKNTKRIIIERDNVSIFR